ncbi:NUDIX hydrolase [Actinotalea sp. M2MS4P-6]|uniref:NUDIX domain-containing protein n=1 Tax=Actinotalea sp. M2MS4P-6 TaxID=2983762 RepID=UPI0021E3981F|nr:NUDIX hydrolase [Actinotalea sp. M2MS4P-6]MCV2393360.1 NUDIX hydrolase [Actinotalea sp. M2MS4P-6]
MSPEPSADLGDAESALADRAASRPVRRSENVYQGRKFGLAVDVVDLGDGGVVTREYLDHPGSVAVLALDEAERVLLLRQYRHPVRGELWELPAGLRDEPGEPAVLTAARELAEEADVTADRWWHLVDYLASPGCSNERVEVFLARGLRPVPEEDRHQRHAEELDMVAVWVPLDEAVAAVLGRRVSNPAAVAGLLAAHVARGAGWSGLEPVDPSGAR